MIVFLSWLIANLEILFLLFVSIMTILKIINGVELSVVYLIGMIIYLVFSAIRSAKSFGGSFFIALISALVYLYLYFENSSLFWSILTPTLIVSTAIGIFTAIFKEAVISRRMLYVNSGVAMFEFSLLYVLNRFFSAFSCMTATLLFSIYFDEMVEKLKTYIVEM